MFQPGIRSVRYAGRFCPKRSAVTLPRCLNSSGLPRATHISLSTLLERFEVSEIVSVLVEHLFIDISYVSEIPEVGIERRRCVVAEDSIEYVRSILWPPAEMTVSALFFSLSEYPFLCYIRGDIIFARLPASLYETFSFFMLSELTSLHCARVSWKSFSISAMQSVLYRYVAHSK